MVIIYKGRTVKDSWLKTHTVMWKNRWSTNLEFQNAYRPKPFKLRGYVLSTETVKYYHFITALYNSSTHFFYSGNLNKIQASLIPFWTEIKCRKWFWWLNKYSATKNIKKTKNSRITAPITV